MYIQLYIQFYLLILYLRLRLYIDLCSFDFALKVFLLALILKVTGRKQSKVSSALRSETKCSCKTAFSFKIFHLNLSDCFSSSFVAYFIAAARWRLNLFIIIQCNIDMFFLSSQKLFKTKHEFIRFGSSLILISISLLKQLKRAFNRPNVHSVTIRAKDKRKPKNSSDSSFSPFPNSSITQGIKG